MKKRGENEEKRTEKSECKIIRMLRTKHHRKKKGSG